MLCEMPAATRYFVKDELHLGPAFGDVLSAIHIIPWSIKPLYGLISDSIPLFGYKV